MYEAYEVADPERPITSDDIGAVDVNAWPLWRKKVPVHATRVRGRFKVETSEGVLSCEDGWLCIDARGYPYPVADDEFQLIYEPTAGVGDLAVCHACSPHTQHALGTIIEHLRDVHGIDPQDVIDAPVVIAGVKT